MIIQETANKFAFWSVDGDALEAFDDSMRLKEKSKDLEGLGINHGMRSSYFVEVTKEYEKAIEFYERGITIKPDYAELINNLGTAYKIKKNQGAKSFGEKSFAKANYLLS